MRQDQKGSPPLGISVSAITAALAESMVIYEMCLDSSYTVVTLANVDPPAAEQVSQFIIGRLPLSEPK